MITIETRDDYITITRLLRKSRTVSIKIKIRGCEYLWDKNTFTLYSYNTVHAMHMNAFMYINNCAVIARMRPSTKKEQLQYARNIVESTRILVNLRKEGGVA